MLNLIEIAGVMAFALSGIIEARRKRMDLVGVYAVAFITAFGGGTVRDLLLDRRPLFWMSNQAYPILILALSVLSLYGPRIFTPPDKWIVLPDALGLGLFSIAGMGYALELGASYFIGSLFGVITGVFGGVIRDVICNEIPAVFGEASSLYATCAFLGCWVYLVCLLAGLGSELALLAGITATFTLRLLALRYNVRLPRPRRF